MEPKGTDTKIKSDFLPHTPEIIDTTMNYIKSENAVDSHVKSYIPAWLRDAPDVEYIDEVHDEMEAKTESQNGWIVTASSIATDAKRGSCIPAWLRNAPEPDLEQVNEDIMEAQAFNELQERRETTIECLMKEIELKDAEQEALVAQLQDAMKYVHDFSSAFALNLHLTLCLTDSLHLKPDHKKSRYRIASKTLSVS